MQHRGERRGLGGIFFDDLNDCDQEMLLSFATGNCLWCLFEVLEKDLPKKKISFDEIVVFKCIFVDA